MICFEIFWQFYFLIKDFKTIQEMHCWLGVDFFWLQVQSKTVLFDVYLKHGNYKSVIVDKIIWISSFTMNELLRNFLFIVIYSVMIFVHFTNLINTFINEDMEHIIFIKNRLMFPKLVYLVIRYMKYSVYAIFEYLIVILPLIMDIEIFTWSLCKKAKN